MQNYFGNFATKDDLDKFARKEDLDKFARKEDLANLRTEMFDKFGKVDKKLGEMSGEITTLRSEMTTMRTEIKLLVYQLAGVIITTFFLSAGSIIAFLNFFTATP